MLSEEQYIELILKSLDGCINESEREALDSWRSQDDNQKIYDDYAKLWDVAGEETEYTPDVSKAWAKFEDKIEPKETKVVEINKPEPKKNKTWLWLAAAAMVGIVVTFMFMNQGDSELLAVSSGNSIEEVKLPDGSTVTLSPDSKIEYLADFEERNITFEGRAFFKIAKNPDKQFKIECNQSSVTVLGTSFNIDSRNEKDKVEVDVVTGKVRFANKGGKQNLDLVKGDQGIYFIESDKLEKSKTLNKNYISWQTNELDFSGLKFEQIFDEISDYFSIEVVCEDKEILNEVSEVWVEEKPDLKEIVEKLNFFYPGTELTSDNKKLIIQK